MSGTRWLGNTFLWAPPLSQLISTWPAEKKARKFFSKHNSSAPLSIQMHSKRKSQPQWVFIFLVFVFFWVLTSTRGRNICQKFVVYSSSDFKAYAAYRAIFQGRRHQTLQNMGGQREIDCCCAEREGESDWEQSLSDANNFFIHGNESPGFVVVASAVAWL